MTDSKREQNSDDIMSVENVGTRDRLDEKLRRQTDFDFNKDIMWVGNVATRDRIDEELREQNDFDFPSQYQERSTLMRADRLSEKVVCNFIARSLALAKIPMDGLVVADAVKPCLDHFTWETSWRWTVIEGLYVFLVLLITPWLKGASSNECVYRIRFNIHEKHGYLYDYDLNGWGKFLLGGMNYNCSRLGSVVGFRYPFMLQDGTVVVSDSTVRYAVVLDNRQLYSNCMLGLYCDDESRRFWPTNEERLKMVENNRFLVDKRSPAEYIDILVDPNSYVNYDLEQLNLLRDSLGPKNADYNFENLEAVSINREANVDNLNIFKVGQLYDEIYWCFVDLFNQRLKEMKYTIVEQSSNIVCSRRVHLSPKTEFLKADSGSKSSDYVEFTRYPCFPEEAFAGMLLF